MSKVSFDFDGTLTQKKYQDIAKQRITDGDEVYIITRRQDTASEPVYAMAKELGIPKDHVHFTNGKLKYEEISRLGIDTHYDDNANEIQHIKDNDPSVTTIKASLSALERFNRFYIYK